MMAVTAAAVMALRNKTGLPMMECKQALQEAGGDEGKAVDILRKKGHGQMSKRAERETSEGRVACHVDPELKRGGIVELRCETAPVAKTDDFIRLANEIARHAAHMADPTPETILDQPLLDNPSKKLRDLLTEVVNRIRENVRVARVASLAGHIGHSTHHNGQVAVLVEMSADCPPDVKADVCMHITASRPACTRREEVDPALVEKERQFAAEQVKDKPANMIDKIVTGKLNRWYSEIVLLEQPFVKEEKKTVGQILAAAAPDLTVNRYLRFEVGQS
jgi:elongation factor Ts